MYISQKNITLNYMKQIKRTAIIGMGALGLLYGEHIASADGNNAVSFILDENRFERYKSRSFTCNGKQIILPMQKASIKEAFDLIIVAVKYNSLESALETMKNCVGPDTIIMSVINGISSEEIIGNRFGQEKMIYTVAQEMDAMREDGNLHYTKKGVLCIGHLPQQNSENLDSVAAYFESIKLPYRIVENILYRIWTKWMLNVGINQTCAAFDTNYGETLSPGKPYNTFIAAMQEVIELSKLEGVNINPEDIQKWIEILKSFDQKGYPSMAQDRKARRKSELEMFAGTVLSLAKKHGINVPANQFLYNEIKRIEAEY